MKEFLDQFRSAYPDGRVTIERSGKDGDWDTLGMLQQLGAIPAPAEAEIS